MCQRNPKEMPVVDAKTELGIKQRASSNTRKVKCMQAQLV